MTTNGNAPTTTQSSTTPDVTFTEAPASLNLRFDYDGYKGIMLTLRDESGLGVLTKLRGALKKLEEMGATPAGGQGGERYANAARPPADANAPMCPTHNASMKKSNHGPGYYCPQKVAEAGGGQDGSRPIYCKAKAG